MTDLNVKLEKLQEQTSFLLEKQQEAAQYCQNQFSELLSMVDQKSQETNEESQDYQDLIIVHEMLSDQLADFENEIADDIDYLSDQLKAIKQISQIGDEKKAEEILQSVLQDGEELLDTAKFKEDLLKESEGSRKSFDLIVQDIKIALQENDIQNLKLVLESMKNEKEEYYDDSDEDFCDDDCNDLDCESSCCTSNCSGCPSFKNGVDIFESFKKDEEDDKDKRNKN